MDRAVACTCTVFRLESDTSALCRAALGRPVFFQTLQYMLPLHSTLDIIYSWSCASNIPHADMRDSCICPHRKGVVFQITSQD